MKPDIYAAVYFTSFYPDSLQKQDNSFSHFSELRTFSKTENTKYFSYIPWYALEYLKLIPRVIAEEEMEFD